MSVLLRPNYKSAWSGFLVLLIYSFSKHFIGNLGLVLKYLKLYQAIIGCIPLESDSSSYTAQVWIHVMASLNKGLVMAA